MPMNDTSCLIYFHGFKSSPESTKALFIKKYAEHRKIQFFCPPLDISPEKAIIQIDTLISNVINNNLKPVIIGSSLGGFYATWIMQNHLEATKCIAIMLNPSTKPSDDLKEEVQDVKAWQEKALGNKFFKIEHLNYLKKLEAENNNEVKYPKNILLVAAKGDEVLDWKKMVSFFVNCEHYLIEGSDHSLSNFPVHWSSVTRFISST